MHINLELMECVYLTSAMLLEIPYMAGMMRQTCNITLAFFLATETEGRRRMISKGFYHQLKNHEKQPLVGTTSNVVIYLSKLSPSYRSS